jgi:putative ABC transport system permease protein
MVRWARRMLRREWRSQALVTSLLLVAVAVTVCGGSMLYNAPSPVDPTFGTADNVYVIKGPPQAMDADIAALRKAYGRIDTIGHTPEKAPGLARPIDYRAQSLGGTYTKDLLAIHRGRYPSGSHEAAVTTGVAQLLGLHLGGSVTLDGHARKIVGIAENPSDLTDDFVLVAPSAGPPPQTVSVFLVHRGQSVHLTTVSNRLGHGSDPTDVVVATLILAGSTILLLLVAFVAAAGFAVLAHRRLRQLGMLAAIGATARQVRLVMTATGLLVGAIGAGFGVALGLLLWVPAAGWVESTAQHRVERLHVPWLLLAGVVALAVLMSTAAAWWPSRAVSRLPVTLALSGRPPARPSTRRPAVLAALFLVAGVGCLAVAGKKHPPLVIVGMVITALAILFAAPLAVRLLAAVASRAPLAVRLALRDLSRHQARSGAAVAALSLALGIPVAIVLVTTSVQATPANGNLSDRQLLVRLTQPDQPASLVPVRTPAQLGTLAAQVDRIAAGFRHPTVLPVDMAYDPTVPQRDPDKRETQQVGLPAGGHRYNGLDVYVATPELLRLVGADPTGIPPSTDVVTSEANAVVGWVPPSAADASRTKPVFEPWPTTQAGHPHYTSLPNTFLTAGALARHHLVRIRAGWLIVSAKPLTDAELAAARRIAVEAGLTIESRDGQTGIQTARASATAAGLLLALAVLAMTVGLIRSEAAADLRTLTATGATGRIRRSLTAATAGGLALLGAVLGTAGAGLGLAAVYRHDLDVFGRVPLVYPLIFLIGVPLAAAAGGWLLAGKEPGALARRASD